MPILSLAERRGTVVGGRFLLGEPIGWGGMGVVFAARDLHAGGAAVVKLPRVELCGEESRALRLSLEGDMLAGLRHPNVVRVLARGDTADGVPFVALEYLEGRTLAEWLGEHGALPAEQALRWVLPIAGALACAHERGVVHRDLKPGNIFLARASDGGVMPKLLDFGAAKSEAVSSITHTGKAIGTRDYMAPEQTRRGVRAAPAMDVWALGAVLHCCLTGEPPPAEARANGEEARRMLRERLELVAGPWLGQVIVRALHARPEARFQWMHGFARALAEAGWQQGLALPADPDPVGLPDFARWRARWEATGTTGVTASIDRAPRARRVLWKAAAAIPLALGLLVPSGGGSEARPESDGVVQATEEPATRAQPPRRELARGENGMSESKAQEPSGTRAGGDGDERRGAEPQRKARVERVRARERTRTRAVARGNDPEPPAATAEPHSGPPRETTRLRREFGTMPSFKRTWE